MDIARNKNERSTFSASEFWLRPLEPEVLRAQFDSDTRCYRDQSSWIPSSDLFLRLVWAVPRPQLCRGFGVECTIHDLFCTKHQDLLPPSGILDRIDSRKTALFWNLRNSPNELLNVEHSTMVATLSKSLAQAVSTNVFSNVAQSLHTGSMLPTPRKQWKWLMSVPPIEWLKRDLRYSRGYTQS